MSTVSLEKFIDVHRAELVLRCRAKEAETAGVPAADATSDRGIPIFLARLVDELAGHSSQTREIRENAVDHGQSLFFEGFTVSQVVHGYGNVCQAITDLAVELDAPISPTDFRTLNRCLDDAIAGAVSEYTRLQRVASHGKSHELRTLIDAAITTFDVLQRGSVGVAGATGAAHQLCLQTIQRRLDARLLLVDDDPA